MNLTRALEVALPDIPARVLAERYPRMDPGVSSREHIEDGQPMVRVYVPCCKGMYTLTPQQWQLAQLFDGRRSYQEIATIFSQQSNVEYDASEVREFAEQLEANEFWYKTAQEKNILLMKESADERRKKLKVKSKWADLSDVTFPAFNPDRFLTWFYGKTKFIYTPWFTVLTLIGFVSCAWLSITHAAEIARDTVAFYSFSNKTWGDVLALYTLGMFVVAVHEFAHAHACKHYGGRVPAMGFALVYLTPAFYTDTTEGFVQGSRYQRFTIAMAGIWSELILCSIATPLWLGTQPETLAHNGAHFVMMMTGMMAVVVNWNPLMKLDGYYMLCEVAGIRDLKEDSTAYVVAWVKRHIWHLPVEVPYVPKRRRVGFAVYALLSGAYSYMVLYFVARFAGNFVRNFSPEWGFVPEIGVALLIFRSRIRLLVNFMKFVYLDKKDRVIAWFTWRNSVAAGLAAAVLLALPVWRESRQGKFVLEPVRSAVVRARVAGKLERLDVREGQSVSAGETVATLSNLPLVSDLEETQSRLVNAAERVNSALVHRNEYGVALREREQLSTQAGQLSEMNAALQIVSPISGTVVSPRIEDQLGAYLPSGKEVLEVADLTALRARIFVSEWEMYNVRVGAAAKLQVDGSLKKWNASVTDISPVSAELAPGLGRGEEANGSTPPQFYQVYLEVANRAMVLRPGMTGVARIYGDRRSLAGQGWEVVRNFWSRKLW